MGLGYVTILEADHHHGRQLRERDEWTFYWGTPYQLEMSHPNISTSELNALVLVSVDIN
ncbi:hypothetical protein KIN20_031283 [Parelaphostrongylus tenuis]|uniref:Uncharacterized protein n=1 Tax=Parelaphostrongylus tenuis TaxID=148309 RepID=A0AAD5R551_PARTN|nr:hypothetical protein KIN20_031283 [Parelaphostrongylus tenuis]